MITPLGLFIIEAKNYTGEIRGRARLSH
ncbi:nuclease-related domain-containing protein [Paenibacillus rhizosphaerae]|nr:nuclease-related domain-containing protein [Paenibacillus rhizosphaerae]